MFALTLPFWALGAVTGLRFLPGVPVAALAVLCPGLAAVLLVYQDRGVAGVKTLLGRSLDYRGIGANIWFPMVLLLPAIAWASFGVIRMMGTPVPMPLIGVGETLALLAVFFIAALGEELGWTGYALDPLQRQWNPLAAGLWLGVVWAVWHIVPLLQAHRSLVWIAWWCLGTVALRVVMVWIYNNTGNSVFAAALVHAISNMCWQLFPVQGSYFDPRINGLIMCVVAAALLGGGRAQTRAAR